MTAHSFYGGWAANGTTSYPAVSCKFCHHIWPLAQIHTAGLCDGKPSYQITVKQFGPTRRHTEDADAVERLIRDTARRP